MISLGNRDANKGLGLGGAVGARAMEDMELEEGEACSYHNSNNEFEDPDVALSYIDEKLQDVLGHFQKDFEGGVSAENLGSKFGGYGSFLPTYQRSPPWSQPRTPPVVQNCNASRSPNNLPSEAGVRNSAVSSTAPQSLKSGPASSTTSLPLMKASTVNEPIKEEVSLPPKKEILNKKNLPDQKSLKVRLKLGSDSLSTKKNAEIYSGLGLVSPSSSHDDSASESEGMSRDPYEVAFESPTTILRVMTSLPVRDGLLLSPLPEHLLNLTEKDRLQKDTKMGTFVRGGIEAARVDNMKVKGEKKSKSDRIKSVRNRDARNGSDVVSREKDIDALACEELVTETLKLPLLSNSYSSAVDMPKDTGRASDASREMLKTLIGDADLSPTEETLEACTQETNWQNRKVISADQPRKKSHKKEKTNEGAKADSNGFMAKNALNSELVDGPKQKSNQKVASNELYGTALPIAKDYQSSGGKKKPKGSQSLGNEAADLPKESSKVVSSLMPKNKKGYRADTSRREVDRYREFFGDIEQEESRTNVLEMHSEDRRKEPELVEKNASFMNNVSKERSTCKKVDQSPISEAYPKVVSGAVSRSRHGPASDAPAQTTAAPVTMIQENWVQCDKCQKWRVLPLGTNPDSLPEKWLCSMLYWLPGMNRCSVSEEETTKALQPLYQTPAPDGQNNMFRGSFGDIRRPDQSYQNHAILHGGKRKPGAYAKDGPSQLTNPVRKTVQASARSESFNDVSRSPVVSEPYPRQHSKSSDIGGEKRKHKHKEKHKVLSQNSDEGGTKSSKMKSKRDPDIEGSRASKKIKTEGSHSTDEVSEHGYRYADPSAKDLKAGMKDGGSISAKSLKEKAKIYVNDDSAARKRKLKDTQETSAGNPLQYRGNFAEEFSDNEYRKEKKARVSKSEGKESSASKGSGKTVKKVSRTKNQQLGKELKRDSVPVQPSVAATSSSSKVSGSQKNVTSFHEAKGSPVESVSSSPMRISNPDKGTSARRSLTSKDEAHENDAGASLKRCSYAEDDDRSNGSGKTKKEKSTRVLDVQDKNSSHLSGDITNRHIANGNADYSAQDIQHPRKQMTKDDCHEEERQNDSRNHANGSYLGKSAKEFSSLSKDKSRNESQDQVPYSEMKPKNDGNKSQEKFVFKSEEAEKRYADKKESVRKLSGDGRRDIQLKSEGHDGLDAISTAKRSAVDCNGERPSKNSSSVKTERMELVNEKGMSSSLPPSGGAQNGTPVRCPRPTPGSQKGSGLDTLAADAFQADDAPKVTKPVSKAENGLQHRYSTSNGHRMRDVDAASPARKESSSQAAQNAMKEAKNLKHLADRFKHAGSDNESRGLYFQAALKFLHGASLMESSSSENARHGEIIHSMQIYSSTAKLCEFCAHEYEKSKDMASAALAYKCMEVAYMRVVFYSHSSASRDRHELQSALQLVPPGESPSSSASDVDNLNHSTAVDKVALSKGVSSPQVLGNHTISARSRPSFTRLLNFTQDVNFAMEASRKSKNAFAAANASLGENNATRESISSVKRALDFNFQDVEGLLRLVRLAMEAISR